MSKMSVWTILAAGALAASLVATITCADSVCNGGVRETTLAERATVRTALEAVKEAFPPAPDGWAIVGDDEISVQAQICRDVEQAPTGAHSAYQWTTTSDGVRTGHALLLFGQWEINRNGIPERRLNPGTPPAAARALSVNVYADESRLPTLLQAIDSASLAKRFPK